MIFLQLNSNSQKSPLSSIKKTVFEQMNSFLTIDKNLNCALNFFEKMSFKNKTLLIDENCNYAKIDIIFHPE